MRGCLTAFQDPVDSIGIQIPLRDKPVGWKPTLQSRRGYTIEIHVIAANNRAQLMYIEMRILDLKRIEGPLHPPNSPRKCFTPLFQLELRPQPPIAIVIADSQHV